MLKEHISDAEVYCLRNIVCAAFMAEMLRIITGIIS